MLEKQFEAYLLSRREREVVRLVVQGLRNKEIADLCFITEQTVKDHLKHVYRKVGVPTRTALIAKVLGLATPLPASRSALVLTYIAGLLFAA